MKQKRRFQKYLKKVHELERKLYSKASNYYINTSASFYNDDNDPDTERWYISVAYNNQLHDDYHSYCLCEFYSDEESDAKIQCIDNFITNIINK